VGLTADAYARMMRHLLPPGKLWRHDSDSVLSKVLLASADEMERIDQRALDLIEEADPRTTTELLPDFERELGLVAEGTLAERRARVVALLLRRQRFRPVDFQQVLAPLLGQDPEDVVVIENSRAFAVLVDDDREIFKFFIYRDPDLPGDYDLAAAQGLVDDMKPSHTAGFVIESINMLCDDPFSLCDRDRLGV
jgi:hypothetical protein